MAKLKLTVLEKIVIIGCILIIAAGFFLFYTNLPGFEHYVQEDGIVEWLTVAGLMAAWWVQQSWVNTRYLEAERARGERAATDSPEGVYQ